MNCRYLLVIILSVGISVVHGQDKTAPVKGDKPKVLTFQPDAATPGAPVVAQRERGLQSTTANPMLDGPAQMVATFFGSLREGKVDEGYGVLTKGSNIAEKPEELKQLKAKTHEAIQVFGSVVGFDFVESRAVGQRLVRATYVSQGTVFPLRWRFYFYKPQDVWRLIDLRVDDKLTGIFDEAEETKSLEPKAIDATP
jgi:hypothetical protein